MARLTETAMERQRSPDGGMLMTRPIEFGIQTGPQHADYDEILAVWQTVEAEGFDHAWTFDHFIPIFSNPEGPCLEGWTTLTALMAQVPRLRAGTLVTGNSYRHPALLANIAATLDVITGTPNSAVSCVRSPVTGSATWRWPGARPWRTRPAIRLRAMLPPPMKVMEGAFMGIPRSVS
jgi:hypothetical protein